MFLNVANGKVIKSTFTKNNATTQNGGAIFWNGESGLINESEFSENEATQSGGAIYWAGANGEISKSTFTKNTAGDNAGAVIWAGEKGNINNSTFTQNKATAGGAIYWIGANGIIAKSEFSKNTAGDNAGAVFMGGESGLITESEFIENEAGTSGSAIFVLAENVNLTDSTFISNKNSANGAVFWQANNGIVSDSKFINNSASVGGAIYWNSGLNGIVKSSTFINNTATSRADAIYWTGSKGNITDSIFITYGTKYIVDTTATDLVANNNWWGDNSTTYNAERNRVNGITLGNLLYLNATATPSIIIVNYTTSILYSIDNLYTMGGEISKYDISNLPEFSLTLNSQLGTINTTSIIVGKDNVSFTSNKSGDGIVAGKYYNVVQNVIIDIIREGTFKDLQYRILYADDVLNLTYNFTYNASYDGNDYINGVLVNKTFTINGNGYTISGNNAARIFNITKSSTLNNITFVNGKASGNGGAISADADVVINNSKFINNTANNGGAIYISSQNSVISIKDSEFVNNSAIETAGALYIVNSNLNINNTNFTSNEGSYSGAIYSLNINAVIDNSKFINNKAQNNMGGAIDFHNGKLNITNSIFNGNTVNNVNKAIYVDGGELSLKGNTINKEQAEIVLKDSAKIVSYLNITIIGNTTVDTIKNSIKINASIVDDEGNLIDATGFKFTLTGLDAVGATYNPTSKLYEETVTIPDEVAVYNVNVTYDGNDNLDNYIGILRNIKGTFTDLQNKIDNADDNLELTYNFTYSPIIDSQGIIINKTITIDGKGFTINALNSVRIFNVTATNTLTLNNSILTNANATSGAAIYSKGTVVVNNSKFFNNTATVNHGGAIYSENSVSVMNSVFESNIAPVYGGAIYVKGSSSSSVKVTVDNVTFENNTAMQGGAIFHESAYLDVNNSRFNANHVVGETTSPREWASGGAILSVAAFTINNSNFTDNTAEHNGGAIYYYAYEDGDAVIDNCIFKNNTANNDYGAVYASKNGHTINLVVNNSKFINNAAKNKLGGALSFDGNDLSVENCEFTNNSAATSYGALNFVGNDLIIKASNFTNNSAKSNLAGAVCFQSTSGKLTVEDSNFVNNTASSWGGAIFASGETSISNSNFTDNNVNGYAGAVFVQSGKLTVDESNFINNSATNYGGAIFASSETSISNSNFTDNEASSGGALYIQSSKLTVDESNFVNNSATNYGGAIYSVYSDVAFDKSNFTDNKAGYGGAVFNYATNSNKFTVVESNFTNNSATGNAGAIYMIAGKNNVSKSYFDGNNINGNKNAIYMQSGELELSENNVTSGVAEIVNGGGKVTSTIKIKVLQNTTYVYDNFTVKLNATVTDDNGNLIKDIYFNFTIADKSVKAVYNSTSKQYEAKCPLDYAGYYIVNVTYITDDTNLEVETGAIKCIRGTFTDLQNKINKTTNGVLNLTYNFIYDPDLDSEVLKHGVVIDKSIVINANGSTINGNNLARIFNITAGNNVILNNITLINGKADNGGAIYSTSNLTIKNSVLINNTATGNEGAGGAVFVSNSALTIECSTFNNNSALYGGAVAHWDETYKYTTTVINSSFDNNKASVYGSAIHQYAAFKYIGSNFTNNKASSGTAVIHYGGDLLDKIDSSIVNTRFENNFAKYYGAIYFYGARSLNISDSQFINNDAGDVARSGAINVVAKNLTVTRTNFTGNKAIGSDGYAGAIYYMSSDNGFLIVDECNFTDNNCSKAGAVFVLQNTNANISNSYFDNNKGSYANSIVSVGNLSLRSNTINSDESEIFVYSNGKVISQINITVMDNKTYDYSFHAIKLYANVTDDNGNIIKHNTFKFLVGTTEVNAKYNATSKLYEADYTPTAVGTFVVSMTYNVTSNLIIKNATVSFSKSLIDIQRMVDEAEDGAIINLTGNYSYIEKFDQDIVNGIVINKNITINASGFTISGNNTARLFNVTAGNTFKLINATITNANASNGAGVYVNKGASLVADHVNFTNNTVSLRGGAIYSEGSVKVNNSIFDLNDVTNRSKNLDSRCLLIILKIMYIKAHLVELVIILLVLLPDPVQT